GHDVAPPDRAGAAQPPAEEAVGEERQARQPYAHLDEEHRSQYGRGDAHEEERRPEHGRERQQGEDGPGGHGRQLTPGRTGATPRDPPAAPQSAATSTPPPRSLARYIAASARARAADRSPTRGTTPRLEETSSRRPDTEYGASTAARTRSKNAALASSSRPAARITNSSPPMRPTRSVARTAVRRRPATCFRSPSPTSWPCSSLTALKPLRSR